jgi:hypothetical protein
MMHTVNIKLATTGRHSLGEWDTKPGWSPCDPANRDVIDAPSMLPTGSHRAIDETDIRYVFGETLRVFEPTVQVEVSGQWVDWADFWAMQGETA